ncbi:serine/threonine-protein kinase [Streptomyces sp. NPDC126503]|uniref:serine/threonine-protein kinase n=1 Tax=Streptomyces sp. NPDC126503 TaxID=3155315 RepID=UPI00331BC645
MARTAPNAAGTGRERAAGGAVLAPPPWTRPARLPAGADTATARMVGPFRVLHRLGAGGMGEVHLCAGPDGVLAAVKTVRAELLSEERIRRRFTREVQAARRVRNPYVVPVIAAETEAPLPWLAQAFVPAPALDHLVRHLGPLPEPVVRALGGGIAVALTGIHGAGVIHRDLKPGNVLLAADGPRVIDFGIARMEDRTVTRGEAWGTPGFMSPEQITDPERVTAASDVFSLGVLLFHAATARLPWRGTTPLELQVRTVEGDADLTGLAPGLRRLVADCLAPGPADRPTPGELVAELRAEEAPTAFGAALGGLRPALESYARAVLHAVPEARVLGAMLDQGRDRRLRERIRALRERAAEPAGRGLPPWAVPGVAEWAGHVPKREAEELSRAFGELAREAADFYGSEDPEAFVLRGEAIRWRGEAAEPAQAAFELGELVEAAAVALGPAAPEVLRLRRLRVTLLAVAGNTGEAILLQEDVLRRVRASSDTPGPAASPDPAEFAARASAGPAAVAEARVELAELYGRAGRPESAAKEYAHALADARAAGAEVPAERIAQWRHQEAFWTRPFDPARALALFRDLHGDCRRELGEAHSLTLEALEGVAYTLGTAGDAEAARDMYEDLLPRARAHFGADSLEALETWANLAGWTGDAGDPARAAELYAEVVVAAVGRWGESHPRVTRWIREARVWRRRAAERTALPGVAAGVPATAPEPAPPAQDAAAAPGGRGARRGLTRWWPGKRRTTPSPAAPDRPEEPGRAAGHRARTPRRGAYTEAGTEGGTRAGTEPGTRTVALGQELAERVHPVFLPPDRFPPALERVDRNVLPGLRTALAIRQGDNVDFVQPHLLSDGELEGLWSSARRNVCRLDGLRTVRTEAGDGDVIAELWHRDDVFVASRAVAPDWLAPALFGTPEPDGILVCVPQMRSLLAAPARPATVARLAAVLTLTAAEVHAGAAHPNLAVSPDVYLVTRGRGAATYQAQRVGHMVDGRPVVGGELLDLFGRG